MVDSYKKCEKEYIHIHDGPITKWPIHIKNGAKEYIHTHDEDLYKMRPFFYTIQVEKRIIYIYTHNSSS